MDRIHAHAAGVDVGSTFHVAAVSGKLTEAPVRSFKSFTADLHAMAVLEARGFDVILVNARDVKNVPGGRQMSTTRNGCSNCTSMAYFERAFALVKNRAAAIKAASEVGRGNHGSPRVHHQLREQGRRIGRKRGARLMRQEGISSYERPREYDLGYAPDSVSGANNGVPHGVVA